MDDIHDFNQIPVFQYAINDYVGQWRQGQFASAFDAAVPAGVWEGC
jgi:hypothetical protein